MNRRVVPLLLVALVVMACAQAQVQPSASFPPAPLAPAGWVSLASVGSDGGPGFTGFRVEAGQRPLALNVACNGNGRLVVTFGPEPLPTTGQDAVVFECSRDAGTTMRHEIGSGLGPGQITVSGAVVPGTGDLVPSVFVISLEEARS